VRIRSAPLSDILRRENVASDNFDAETLSKLLAVSAGSRGSIAQGAAVIQAWARAHGADVTTFDASGLSSRDRVTTGDMARLLSEARDRPWGDALFRSLPVPGEGTLAGRLAGLPVSAKTGTLIQGVSALSGYVLLADGRMASFSILSRGLSKDGAVAVEDAVVRLLAMRA
jgi:serine-type D-Ala-D-Ala carboxypeptidase/endopeptidase (penicillin-binding protein 4)